MIILFVVAVIVLADRFNEHRQFVNQLDTLGQDAWALVVTGERSSVGIYVTFRDAADAERAGFVRPQYYSEERLQTVKAGAEIRVRYLPAQYASYVVLSDQLETVRAYRGYATDVLLALAFSWLWIVIYPDFLYLGYVDDNQYIWQRRFK